MRAEDDLRAPSLQAVDRGQRRLDAGIVQDGAGFLVERDVEVDADEPALPFHVHVTDGLLFPVCALAANSSHAPGTPFRACRPRCSNSRPDPATRSFTVLDTRSEEHTSELQSQSNLVCR